MARGCALLALTASLRLLAGFAPPPTLCRAPATARRRNVRYVEIKPRTEPLTKRLRRRNGAAQPMNEESPEKGGPPGEANKLSVIASSVMALGVLPGAEIKLILENLCSSLPPDEFKAFLLVIGANLAPQYHKNICCSLGPDFLTNGAADTFKTTVNGTTRYVSRALLPKRAAKAFVNRWLRESDAPELKEVVMNALKRIGTRRLEMMAPVCLAAVFDQPVRTKEEVEVVPQVELSPACAAWAVPRLALALSPVQRSETMRRNIGSLSDGDARALLNDLALSWNTNDATLERVLEVALSDPRQDAPAAERALAKRLPTRVKNQLLKMLAPSFADDLELLASLGDFGGARRYADAALGFLSGAPRASGLAKARGALNAKLVAAVARQENVEERVLRGAVKALAQPRDAGPLAGFEVPWTPWVQEQKKTVSISTQAALASRASRDAAGTGPTVARLDAGQRVAEAAVRDAVDTLPPALVASQLRAVVARLPADFIRQEAVTLLETLPSKELVDAAAGLVDAAPEGILRKLVSRLLDAATASRLKLTRGLATGGVVTLQTLGVAVDSYDVMLLRSTAETLLYGAPPEALIKKVRDILLSTPAENIRGGVLRALDAAAIKANKYDSLKSMLAAKAPIVVEDVPINEGASKRKEELASNLKNLFLRKTSKGPELNEDSSSLEELITAAFKELRPEVILDLTLETLAALPPDAFESLSRLLVVGLWDRLLLAQLPDPISRGLRDVVDTLDKGLNSSAWQENVEAGAAGVVLTAGARNVLAKFSVGTLKATALGGGFAKLGAFVLVGGKAIALAGVVVAGRLFLQDAPPETFDDLTTALAEDALIVGGLVAVAAYGVTKYDRMVAETDGPARVREAGDRSRAALVALLATEDDLSRRTLRRLALTGTTRGAAAACRNLLVDEYLDAGVAQKCKQRYESYLRKRDSPIDLQPVEKSDDKKNPGDVVRGLWTNLRERFSRDEEEDTADAKDAGDAVNAVNPEALFEEAARLRVEAANLEDELSSSEES